jgi:hypothetical protein
MSKLIKPAATVTTDVIEQVTAAATAAPATMPIKPQIVRITDSHMKSLHKMTALCRDGYIPIEISAFGFTGMTNIVMQLGDPEPLFVAEANTDVQAALEIEAHQRQVAIEEAAAQLVADREKAAKQAAIAAEIEIAEAAIRKLKRTAAAVQ